MSVQNFMAISPIDISVSVAKNSKTFIILLFHLGKSLCSVFVSFKLHSSAAVLERS